MRNNTMTAKKGVPRLHLMFAMPEKDFVERTDVLWHLNTLVLSENIFLEPCFAISVVAKNYLVIS